MPKLADWFCCLVAMAASTTAVGWSAEPSTGVPVHATQAVAFRQTGNRPDIGPGRYKIVAADFTGDGRVDIAIQKDQLLDGGEDGAWLAVGDLNRDRAPDFVIAHWTGDFISVFLNDGHGRLESRRDYTTGLGCYGVVVVDVDGDGNLDALSANYRERTLSFLRGVGDGTFQPAAITNKGLKRVSGVWTPE